MEQKIVFVKKISPRDKRKGRRELIVKPRITMKWDFLGGGVGAGKEEIEIVNKKLSNPREFILAFRTFMGLPNPEPKKKRVRKPRATPVKVAQEVKEFEASTEIAVPAV